MTKISARALKRALAVGAAAIAIASLAACTSFAFKRRGKGSAPSDLQDRAAMARIGGGSFEMGAQNAQPDEFPVHKVTLDEFYIDRHEVTRGEYNRCVDARVCRAPGIDEEEAPEGVDTDKLPVLGVSWYDAKKYCDWVGKRLPTEAEWERAARHPKYSAYPWQGKFEPKHANLRGDADGFEKASPVGSFPSGASGTGVMDLAGNAAEWCADWYESTYYQKSPEKNPKGPAESTGSRVVRGGAFTDNDFIARSTSRASIDPNLSNDSVGFRCAAE